jgi:hypothetical protein
MELGGQGRNGAQLRLATFFAPERSYGRTNESKRREVGLLGRKLTIRAFPHALRPGTRVPGCGTQCTYTDLTELKRHAVSIG